MKLPLWLSRLFADLAPSRTMHTPGVLASPVAWPDPPVAPSIPLSCFAAGIVKSLETEPDQWERDYHAFFGGIAYRHKTLFTLIKAEDFYNYSKTFVPGAIEDHTLTRAECAAVLAALKTHVIEPAERKAAEGMAIIRAMHQVEFDKSKAAFEKLGCPTPPTP